MARKFTLATFFSDFAGSLLAEFVARPLRAGGKAMELRIQKLTTDERGELFDELRRMHRRDTDNLFRRHREAMKAGRENRLISLLCKIPKHAEKRCQYGLDPDAHCPGCRREGLRDLNHYSDEAFSHTLELLDHDPVRQQVAHVWREGRRRVRGLELGDRVVQLSRTLRQKDHEIAGRLRAWSDRLEERDTRSRRRFFLFWVAVAALFIIIVAAAYLQFHTQPRRTSHGEQPGSHPFSTTARRASP